MERVNKQLWDWEIIQRLFRERRKLFGWTIDEAAAKAGVSRDTIIRVEKGLRCGNKSLHRLRSTYAIFSAQLTHHAGHQEHFSTCRANEIQWLASTNRDHSGRLVANIDYSFVNDSNERQRRAQLGFQSFFSGFIRSELEDGVMNAGLMEIYSDSWVDRHYGEEFVYCLSGSAIIEVEGVGTEIYAGDSIIFDAWKPHRYRVNPDSVPPAKILFVVAKRPDEAERTSKSNISRSNWGV